MSRPGTIYGVGLGPGDPDLMSLRAARLLRGAAQVAYFRTAGRAGRARQAVNGLLAAGAAEIAMEYPVTTEIPVADPRYNTILARFYAAMAARLRALSGAGEDVVVLCEGDPFFYGSFMHLYTRLKDVAPVEVVPGITGMSAAWTATGQPITWGDDIMTILMGTLPEDVMAAQMRNGDALIVMKLGRTLDKVRRALRTAGRFEDAWLIECATMPEQKVMRLAQARGREVPYFSIVVVHGSGRRP